VDVEDLQHDPARRHLMIGEHRPPVRTIVKSRKYLPGGNALIVRSSVTLALRATVEVRLAARCWVTAAPVTALYARYAR